MKTTDLYIKQENGSCKLRLDNGGWEVVLDRLRDPEQYELLRWYFEDYAERDPFKKDKALEAAQVLTEYGKRLLQQLDVVGHSTEIIDNHVTIAVDELVLNNIKTNGVLWEILENLDLWPSSSKPASVTVIRTITSTGPSNHTAITKDVFRLLIVTARPQGQQDVPHRFVSKLVFAIARDVNQRHGKRAIEIHILRPGTFEALERWLSDNRDAVDLVHFDVHGVEKDNE